MIKAIILDLDDTLIDTTEQLTEPWEEMLVLVLSEQTGRTLREIKSILKRFKKTNMPTNKLTLAFCEHFGINYNAVKEEVSRRISLSSLKLSYDAKRFLRSMGPYKIFLITTGSKILQERKLQHLGLVGHFTVFFDESDGNKTVFMKKILGKYSSEELICIGDNIKNEITAANSLNISTIRVLKGKRKDLRPEKKDETPTWTVHTLQEALKIIETQQRVYLHKTALSSRKPTPSRRIPTVR